MNIVLYGGPRNGVLACIPFTDEPCNTITVLVEKTVRVSSINGNVEPFVIPQSRYQDTGEIDRNKCRIYKFVP